MAIFAFKCKNKGFKVNNEPDFKKKNEKETSP